MGNIDTFKQPYFENDSYLIRLKNFHISNNKMSHLMEDEYLAFKMAKFRNEDISTDGFSTFSKDRPSLRFMSSLQDVSGSIYTYKVGKENGLSYDDIINQIRKTFEKFPTTRRLMLRVANNFSEYRDSVNGGIDVSCLNLIHYLSNEAKLVFRSSDILNELWVDVVTIYEFFLKPIYPSNIDIEIFASTSQNTKEFKKTITDMENKFYDQ